MEISVGYKKSLFRPILKQGNNKYMKNYDTEKPSKYNIYLDANSLYRWSMSKPLPTHDVRQVDDRRGT